jgi:glycosyltransferase involved in cell wall biosynthesis
VKFWLLTTEYPPFYGGGISTYCYHTCCMLSEKGHQVTVFVNDRKVRSLEIEQKTEARIIRFNPGFTKTDAFLGNIAHLSYEFAMIVKKFIEQEGKPDHIESQDYNGIAYFLLQHRACLFDWCQEIPIVITMHSPSFLYLAYNQAPVYKRPNFWIGEMERFCIQAADLVISPSQYLIDELKKQFAIRTSNLHVIPNPYQFVSIANKSKDADILNNSLTFYGKLSPQKGAFRILKEFQELWDKGFNESFTMIGGQEIVFSPSGKTMGTIIKKEYASYIKKGFLKLKDKISPAERAEFLSGSTLFIIPSIVDNLPYAVLELMSLGKILIVSKQGGHSEIISADQDGFIFDYSQEGSFEQILKKVLVLSKEERIKISKHAIKKIVENYSYDHIYSSKIKLLNNLKASKIGSKQFPFIRTIPLRIKEPGMLQSNDSLLSVIIPYYNLGPYLDEAVNSVLNVTYKNIEIIIVNDGSCDPQSIEKLEKYRDHKAIRVVDKKNTGLADTRNVAADLARGSFMAFLDADDTVAPTYYEKAMKILLQYENVHFVGAWTQYFGNSKVVWPTFNPEPPLILTHNCINSSSLVYKTKAFLDSGKNDPAFKIGLEDYESVINMKAAGLNGVAIPEVLFNYRVRSHSMIKNSTTEVRADYYNKIEVKHKAFFLEYKKEIEQLIKNNGLPLSLDNSTLDELPFQHLPVVGPFVRKLFLFAKATPRLKKIMLRLKNVIGKQ